MIFLYIDKFKWSSIDHQVSYEGHPKEGRVYKSFYNENDKTYTISLIGDRGILIQDLNGDPDNYCYSSKIQILTKENILDLQIQDEDLDKMIRDMEPQQQPPINNLMIAIQRQENEERAFIQDFIDKVTQLYTVNSIQAEVVLDIVDSLFNYNLSKNDDSAGRLELDKNRGLSINIGAAYRALDSYSSEDRRMGEHHEDLITASMAIIREAERRILNDLD